MKQALALLLMAAALQSRAQTENLTDGPFVFYRNADLLVLAVHKGVVQRDSLPYEKREGYSVQVPWPGGAKPFFTVPLKRQLVEEPSEFKADKMLVLSDIEGEFALLQSLLQKSGVIDGSLNWCFGKGHLVVCGDVFDRGDEVTACLWLLYKLEEEAKAKGGRVHVILGNHEVMNLSEDFRYVHPKHQQAAAYIGATYADLYTVNTELGRWLRTKNIMEKIGGHLFAHGGVSQAVNEAGLSLQKINSRVQPVYDKDGFDSVLLKQKAMLLFRAETSPFWYRGYFTQPMATTTQIDSTLHLYGVRKILVGHTVVPTIKSWHGGRVIALDVNQHKGSLQALLIEGGQYFRIDESGSKTMLE